MASLALYWSVMIACYLLASRLRRYADRLGFVNTLLSVSVYALVFVMGLRMGANREVTDNLGVIGVQARRSRRASAASAFRRFLSRC